VQQRDVEVDRCLTCDSLVSMDREGELDVIRCQPMRRLPEFEDLTLQR
jgi:hypothetical protein